MGTVLIIDEDPKWQDRLTEAFQNTLGYKTVIVTSYEQAITVLEQAETPFDFVTVDMDLPVGTKMDDTWMHFPRPTGFYVLKFLASQHRGEMCIVISGDMFGIEAVDELAQYKPMVIGHFNKNKIKFGDLTELVRSARTNRKRVFISYRHQDSEDISGRICDRLVNHFGQNNVFFDQQSIPLGVDFRAHIRTKLQECDALLAIIGREWTNIRNDVTDEPRLFNAEDFVRIEITEAFNHGIPVIPLLVQGATMPREKDLPPELHPLVFQNGSEIPSGSAFHDAIDTLIRRLETLTR